MCVFTNFSCAYISSDRGPLAYVSYAYYIMVYTPPLMITNFVFSHQQLYIRIVNTIFIARFNPVFVFIYVNTVLQALTSCGQVFGRSYESKILKDCCQYKYARCRVMRLVAKSNVLNTIIDWYIYIVSMHFICNNCPRSFPRWDIHII